MERYFLLYNKTMKSFVPQNLHFVREYSIMPGGGGGGAGAIKKGGGAFKQMGAAKEELYFHKHNLKILQKLKKRYSEEIDYHEHAIQDHRVYIEKLKQDQAKFEKEDK